MNKPSARDTLDKLISSPFPLLPEEKKFLMEALSAAAHSMSSEPAQKATETADEA